MSDYHITVQDKDKKSANVIFHVPVPEAGQNEAGLSWRDAIVRAQGGSANIVSVLSDIEPAEQTKLESGEIYEKQDTVRFSSKNLTPAQRKVEIEARFNELKVELIQEKQKALEWIGYQRNVS